MTGARVDGYSYALNDGFGDRSVETQVPHGLVEVLRLAPALAGHAAVEPAIRARAARLADLETATFAAVRRVERDAAGIRVVADAASGTRLSELLARLALTGEILSHAAMLELAGGVVRTLALLHKLPGGLAHGAITPAHIVLGTDAAIVLTDGVFGAALESLQWNREQLWRQFHLALPAAASLPRFDHRADITQVGVLGVSLLLRRPLRETEFPRPIEDLIIQATTAPVLDAQVASALRMWLQQALQVKARGNFTSGLDAAQAYAELPLPPGARRAGVQALRGFVERVTAGQDGLSEAVA